MRVPLVDLVAQHASIRDDVMRAAAAVIDAQAFILGEPVARFERALASACETEHAIGVASGSDALTLAVRASGVGEGDAVVTTAFTFVATVNAFFPRRDRVLMAPSFFSAWITIEMAPWLLFWEAAGVAYFVAEGSVKGTKGVVALGLAVATCIGLVVMILWSRLGKALIAQSWRMSRDRRERL